MTTPLLADSAGSPSQPRPRASWADASPTGATPRVHWLEVAVVAAALLLGLLWRIHSTSDFIFAGADSYSYTSAATELRTHHRYGFRLPPWYPERPEQVPPGRCRPPGYPLLLAALGTPDEQNYSPFFEYTKHVQWFIDIAAALLLYLLGRSLAGRLVAGLALAAYLVHPTVLAYTASIMTETLAIAVSTLALCLCAWAVAPFRPLRSARRALCGAGVAVALGMLIRADGVLLGPCLLLPLVLRREHLGERVRLVALAAGCALITYSPWVIRNIHTFGAPYPFGSLCEIDGTPIERTWFHNWYASWVRTEMDLLSTQGCIYRRTCGTAPLLFPEYAFDSDEENQKVNALLLEQSLNGMTEYVDAEFHALWQDKVRSHPVRTFLVAPAHRVMQLWLGANDLPVRARPPLHPIRLTDDHERYELLAQWTAWLALSGGLVLLLPVWRRQRRLLWIAMVAIGVRTAFLALFGFPEPRYTLELLPLVLLLAAVAVVTPLRLLWGLR